MLNRGILRESAIALIELIAGVDMHTVATVNQWTCPVGKEFDFFGLYVRPNHSLASMVLTLGQTSDKDSLLSPRTLTNVTVTTGGVWLLPLNAATPAAVECPATITAGQIVCLDITTGATADPATADIEIYGRLRDA